MYLCMYYMHKYSYVYAYVVAQSIGSSYNYILISNHYIVWYTYVYCFLLAVKKFCYFTSSSLFLRKRMQLKYVPTFTTYLE